jgi:DNA-binding CsgD family transcriptional regulator
MGPPEGYDQPMANRGRPPHNDVLTPAEWRIAHAVKHGMTNREIAERRGISPDAVKFHVANVLAKLQLPNRRALRQWFRAPKESALQQRETSMVIPTQLGPLGPISRSVKSVKDAEPWYRDVLGLEHLYTFGTLSFFNLGGTRLLLTQEEASGDSILYFRVEDIEGAHQQLRSRGVEFINAPHMIHKHADGVEEWMAFFKDPEGRPLAIMSQTSA